MDPLLTLLPAGSTFTVLGLVIVYLLRQDRENRKQAAEHFARISKENAELRADVEAERDGRHEAEDEAAALRRRLGVTRGPHD